MILMRLISSFFPLSFVLLRMEYTYTDGEHWLNSNHARSSEGENEREIKPFPNERGRMSRARLALNARNTLLVRALHQNLGETKE